MPAPKKIFKSLIRVLPLSLSFLIIASTVHAQKITHYRTYHPGTGEEFNHFHSTMEKNSSGGYQAHWTIEDGESTIEEDYTLGPDLETLRFRVVNVDDRTDYMGAREGSEVTLRGQFKGEAVNKTVQIDEKPFYYNPKLGLSAFVLSGAKKIRFWGFQNKELKIYPMKATNEGAERILVNGKEIEAYKINWTVDDFRAMFFKRTYWFRKSDGLYVKQESDGGKFRDLVSEEGE